MARRWGSRRWRPTAPVSSAAATASTGRLRWLDGRPLSNTVGTVLDPVFALRRRVRVAPGAIVRIAFWTVVAETRAAVLDLVDKHRDATAFERATTLAWTQAQVQLHHLGIDPGEAGPVPADRRPSAACWTGAAAFVRHHPAAVPARSRGCGPWAFPATCRSCCCASPTSSISIIARQLLQAHEYWRMKQLAVDLVILNERASSYVQDLQSALETLVRASQSRPPVGEAQRHGRVFVLRADLVSPEARALLASVARVVLVGQRGSLADQLDRVPEPEGSCARPCESPRRLLPWIRLVPVPPGLEFFNGLGGFAEDGREYVDDPRPGPGDAGTLDQCHRQSRLRLSGIGGRRRLHLVGQQPREPAYAVVERSGQRSSGRGVLSPRRRQWRPMVPDGTADPRQHRHLCCPARLGLQPLRACGPWHCRRTAAVRSARRSDKDLAADAPQHVAPYAAPFGDRLRGMGTGSIARSLRTVRDDRDRSRHRRDVRAQSMECRLRIARCLRRSRGAPDRLDGRSARVHRPQWHTGKSSSARRCGPALQYGRRRSRSVQRAAKVRRAAAKCPRRNRVLPRRSSKRARCQHACRAIPEG